MNVVNTQQTLNDATDSRLEELHAHWTDMRNRRQELPKLASRKAKEFILAIEHEQFKRALRKSLDGVQYPA